ncbi:hypothetical protein BDR04DRAFT_1112433 [Suillus decipiens]|nr:hypothetical protein BDR04DRAFT_1112433 [Suillus decipiens]
MPIPLLALMVTAVWSFLLNFLLYSLIFKVYVALFWKTLGSPGKFNFIGNQFSKTYVFHIKFLKDLKRVSFTGMHGAVSTRILTLLLEGPSNGRETIISPMSIKMHWGYSTWMSRYIF